MMRISGNEQLIIQKGRVKRNNLYLLFSDWSSWSHAGDEAAGLPRWAEQHDVMVAIGAGLHGVCFT